MAGVRPSAPPLPGGNGDEEPPEAAHGYDPPAVRPTDRHTSDDAEDLAALLPRKATLVRAADLDAVAAQVEALGRRCSLADVCVHSGRSVDQVEAALTLLLRDGGGGFEIGRDGRVLYSFSQGFASRARNRRRCGSIRRRLKAWWPLVFYVLRVSVGAFLLLSFTLMAVVGGAVACAAAAASNRGGGRGHGNRRTYGSPFGGGGGGMLGGNVRQLLMMMFVWNPFFRRGGMGMGMGGGGYGYGRRRRRFGLLGPMGLLAGLGGAGAGAVAGGYGRDYGYGYDNDGAVAQVRQPPRRVVEGRLLTREEQAAHESRVAAGGSDGAAGADVEAGGDAGGAAGAEQLPFLEAVFSFVFGEGPPPPDDDDIWSLIAVLIAQHGGVVTSELLLPWVSQWQESDDSRLDGHMPPVLARFGGRPVAHANGFVVFEFPLLMKAGAAVASRRLARSPQSAPAADAAASAGARRPVRPPAAAPVGRVAGGGDARSASAASSDSEWIIVSEASSGPHDEPPPLLVGQPEKHSPKGEASPSSPFSDVMLPAFLDEGLWEFTAATPSQMKYALALGIANLLGALLLYASDDTGTGSATAATATTSHHGRSGLATTLRQHPVVAALYSAAVWLSPCIIMYSLVYLGIPLVRYYIYEWLNKRIAARNEAREAAAKSLGGALRRAGVTGGALRSFDALLGGADGRTGSAGGGGGGGGGGVERWGGSDPDDDEHRTDGTATLRAKLAFAAAVAAGDRRAAL